MSTTLIDQPWHWSVAGLAIAATMLTIIYFGKFFGLSSTYRTICALTGAGTLQSFFRFRWRDQVWNLCFAAGIILGSFLTREFLTTGESIRLSVSTKQYLHALGLLSAVSPQQTLPLLPEALFGIQALAHLKTWLILIGGGILSGFGARYAGGCTSGHLISGLANLQLPSLIMLAFFMAGGILMTNFFLPLLFGS